MMTYQVVDIGLPKPRIITYQVSGSTVAELWDSIMRNTIAPEGFPAYTWWCYRWWPLGGNRVLLNYQLLLFMPQLAPSSAIPEAVKAEWRRYHKATWTHEQRHVALFLAAIERMKDIGNPERFKQIEELANSLSAEFDEITSHGVLEGASLPLSAPPQDFSDWLRQAIERIRAA
jgi:hypothetical protein